MLINKLSSRRTFLSSLGAVSGTLAVAFPAGGAGAAGEAFLQVTLYQPLSRSEARGLFAAVDRYYSPLLVKAPGLISYERFRHYDLPQVLDVQLWQTRDQALSFYDSAAAHEAWKKAISKAPPGLMDRLDKSYRQETHSAAHRHFILQKSLKG